MKSKKLKLKPSVRDKRRYLLIGAENAEIEKAILDYIGVLGFGKAGYMKVKSIGGKTVGSVVRGSLNDVCAALAMGKIKIEKVSGTLKGLGKK